MGKYIFYSFGAFHNFLITIIIHFTMQNSRRGQSSSLSLQLDQTVQKGCFKTEILDFFNLRCARLLMHVEIQKRAIKPIELRIQDNRKVNVIFFFVLLKAIEKMQEEFEDIFSYCSNVHNCVFIPRHRRKRRIEKAIRRS